jgi:hypothetical protein
VRTAVSRERRLANVQPLVEEEASIALAEDTRRAALAVAQPKLNPPRCALQQLVGDTHGARGALPPSAAKSTLTRDARAKAARIRSEAFRDMAMQLPGFRLAVGV